MYSLSLSCKELYPTAHAGFLVMRGVNNPSQHPALDEHRIVLEQGLRQQFAGQDRASLARHPTLQAYKAYYRRYDKTYHVQGQLESLLWKGKSIPSVAALVEAMFMAELKNLLLTAGHDLDAVQQPITVDIAANTDSYRTLRGQEQAARPGDMLIRDGLGILSTILYGPDERSQITPSTRNALFTVYAPDGIPTSSLQAHLEDLRRYVLLFAPEAQSEIHILGF